MNPAWSVIFLTTLIGAGQGLFLALLAVQFAAPDELLESLDAFLELGAVLALVLTLAGLVASFFHLGRPERAWRAAAQWRTSWLSREVIALPLFMGLLVLWAVAGFRGSQLTPWLGLLAAAACLALFVCTAMVYASVRFLQEWASAFTGVNLLLLGLASGFTLATALAAVLLPEMVWLLGQAAMLFTGCAWLTRWLSLRRNDRLKPRSTLQSAIGIRHPTITQRAMGFMGGSFNTREFFHGRAPGTLKSIRWIFQLGSFVLPLILLAAGLALPSAGLLILAFAVQYLGLLAERWYFLAQARHPQNLYYQAVS